ncbi:MAG TPA: hypothetical protein VF092_10565 [Longimicrobium sp.]
MIDTVTLVSIVLSAVGAGGGLLPAVRKIRALARERRRRRDTRETPQEFYYRSCLVALRVVVPDREYVQKREAVLVARRDGLVRVPWGSRPYGEIQVIDEHVTSPDPALAPAIVDAEATVDQSDGWTRRYMQFGRPLRRNQEAHFAHVQTTVVVGKPLEHFLRWSPVARCDHTTLQVAFAGRPPESVRYSAHGPTGEELEGAPVALDVITGAYTVQIDNPIPGRYYKLRW